MRMEQGRVAVVTGGASGIGYALAAAAASRGLPVVLSDVRADALDAAAGRLRESGAAVTTVVADVSQPADIDRLARTAFALGSVQLVCSNAGIVVAGRAWELTAADWERVMGVNFMATVHLARAFVPRLIEAGQPARLLVTGSMASVTARPGISPYVAAKHALLGLCESLNRELADTGADFGVTLLLPGKVATGMSSADYRDAITPDEAARIAFDAVADRRPLAFTHADRIPEVEQRFAAIVADGRPREILSGLGFNRAGFGAAARSEVPIRRNAPVEHPLPDGGRVEHVAKQPEIDLRAFGDRSHRVHVFDHELGQPWSYVACSDPGHGGKRPTGTAAVLKCGEHVRLAETDAGCDPDCLNGQPDLGDEQGVVHELDALPVPDRTD